MASDNYILIKDIINDIFEYRDGNLYWKQTFGYRAKVGTLAGTKNLRGYIQIGYKRKNYMAHKLIFLMHHGYAPKIIDHIDNNRCNNKIENLREATLTQNRWNCLIRKDNTSGVKGVTWHKKANKWVARGYANNTIYMLGYFKEIEEAKKAIEIFRKEKHGIFANNG